MVLFKLTLFTLRFLLLRAVILDWNNFLGSHFLSSRKGLTALNELFAIWGEKSAEERVGV